MTWGRKSIIAIVLALAAIASPSLAHQYKNGVHMTAARAKAMRECNLQSQKYTPAIWGNLHIYIYRACMADRHQLE